jgi:predicted acetyltransferase
MTSDALGSMTRMCCRAIDALVLVELANGVEVSRGRAVAAKTDGYGHLTRLAAEFAQSPAVFQAIFACHLDGRLAGIGAITDEPASTSQPTWRMRRLYVHRKFRRRKVARAIAKALLQEAAANVSVVTVHAGRRGPVLGGNWIPPSCRLRLVSRNNNV